MPQLDDRAYLRRWPRYKIDARLKVLVADASPAFGRANNLSFGGMGAYIPCAIPVGEQIVLEVNFPHSPSEVKVKAVVRSAEGFRYGLEFVDVPPNVRTIIEKNCGGLAT
jgi:PilZ domain